MVSQGAKVDCFIVGERLITSASSPLFGGVYKLSAIEKDGKTVPKINLSENVRKITIPSSKQVYRLIDKDSGKASRLPGACKRGDFSLSCLHFFFVGLFRCAMNRRRFQPIQNGRPRRFCNRLLRLRLSLAVQIQLHIQLNQPRRFCGQLLLLRERLTDLGLCRRLLVIEVFKLLLNAAQTLRHFIQRVLDTDKVTSGIRTEFNPMIARIREADPALYEEMTRHGRRNIAMLTIAPTGTTSLMSQTTSGIEPVFRPVYTRRRKVNPSDKDVKITFVDEVGDSWEEYERVPPQVPRLAETSGYDLNEVKSMSAAEIEKLVALSPYYKATANDIDWVSKVRMQGAIQKWVDHSISVTVNLPNEVTEELVGKVYMTAWEHGCKGVTVYRDGSRAGVLVESKKKKKGTAKVEEGEAAEGGYRPPRKRPIELTADIVRFKNGEEDWIAFVGIYNGRPYEIFTGKIEEDAMFIPKKIKKGVILKVVDSDGRKRYDFQYKDKYGYTNTIGGISRLFDKQFWNYAKLISGVLRNGMPILDVVTLIESLQLDSESINTWKNGVARALKQYIANGTKVKEKCPNCGQETLVYQNSCPVCMSCGYSKCG